MKPDLQEFEVKNIKQGERYDTETKFSGKPSKFSELEKRFHAELTTKYWKRVHQKLFLVRNPHKREAFCQIQATFQQVYGSMHKGRNNKTNYNE